MELIEAEYDFVVPVQTTKIIKAKVQVLQGSYPVIIVRDMPTPLTADLQKVVDKMVELYQLNRSRLTLINYHPQGIAVAGMNQYKWAVYNNLVDGQVSNSRLQGVEDNLIEALLACGAKA